ncbi:hypothetical protein [Neisseria sp. Ec49-e6-T10]|uniref:hypothetical protein n=1 Tax=Neisseria sp. Ec49-e6-T10 TaxID=3140744 RepID=UPI003EC05BDF
MRLYEQLLQTARDKIEYRIKHAKVYVQEYVTFQELMLAEGKTQADFSEKAWQLMEQVIQYPFDEFAYFSKEPLPQVPAEIEDEELLSAFLLALGEVLEEEALSLDEINALPLGFRIAYYLLQWEDNAAFRGWLLFEENQRDLTYVNEVIRHYTVIGLKTEAKAIQKALRYCDKNTARYDKEKALIAYVSVKGNIDYEQDAAQRDTFIFKYLYQYPNIFFPE